jgi:transposase
MRDNKDLDFKIHDAKKLRREGWTIRDIAKRIGFKPVTISRWVGHITPRVAPSKRHHVERTH